MKAIINDQGVACRVPEGPPEVEKSPPVATIETATDARDIEALMERVRTLRRDQPDEVRPAVQPWPDGMGNVANHVPPDFITAYERWARAEPPITPYRPRPIRPVFNPQVAMEAMEPIITERVTRVTDQAYRDAYDALLARAGENPIVRHPDAQAMTQQDIEAAYQRFLNRGWHPLETMPTPTEAPVIVNEEQMPDRPTQDEVAQAQQALPDCPLCHNPPLFHRGLVMCQTMGCDAYNVQYRPRVWVELVEARNAPAPVVAIPDLPELVQEALRRTDMDEPDPTPF